MSDEKYAEDYPILVSPQGDGFQLGAFYSFQTSEIVGGPPDPALSNPSPANSETLPIRSLSYDLKHLKDTKEKEQTLSIGLELILKTFIGINVTFGMVQYDTKYNSKVENDHLQIYYLKQDKVKRLLPTEDVIELLQTANPPPNATHIIMETFTGVHLQGDILIKDSNSSKLVNKKSAGLGSLIIGPISAAIEAALKAVLDNPGNSVVTEINIESTHNELFPSLNPNLDEVFEGIKRLNGADPLPIKMLAVPIKHILLNSASNQDTLLLPPFALEMLKDKIALLKDYASYEEEDPDTGDNKTVSSKHYSKQISLLEPRLNLILRDTQNPITSDITKKEGDWNTIANTLYSDGCQLVNRITNPIPNGTTLVEIENFVKDCDLTFNTKDIQTEISKFVDEGREQLYLIQANDVDQFTQAKFAAGELSARALLRQESGQAALILDMCTFRDNSLELPSSLFLQIYSLRNPLLEIIVRMPNVSDSKFSLTLRPTGQGQQAAQEYMGPDEINRVLQVLAAGFGSAVINAPASRFYQALAAKGDSEGRKLSLPISSRDDVVPFLTFLEGTSNYTSVLMFPTFMTLKRHILSDSKDPKKIIIVLPTTRTHSSLPMGLDAFIRLHGADPPIPNLEFAVGDFDLKAEPVDYEGPLLLAFKDGVLISQCLAYLDFLHLEYVLKKGDLATPADFASLKGAMSSFYPNRSALFSELRPLFEFSFFKKPSFVLHPLPEGVDKEEVKKIRRALLICMAFMETLNPMEEIITALTRVLLEEEYIPTFGATLDRKLGWSQSGNKFNHSSIFNEEKETRKMLREVYEVRCFLLKDQEEQTRTNEILNDILSIIPLIEEEEGGLTLNELEIRKASRDIREDNKRLDILKRFVRAVNWDESGPEIEDLLNKGLVLPLMGRLTEKLYPSWHTKLATMHSEIQNFDDNEKLMEVVEKLDTLGLTKDFEHHFIWSDAAFSEMVYRAIDSDITASKKLFDSVSTLIGGDYWEVPPYIPTRIVKVLRRDHLTPSTK